MCEGVKYTVLSSKVIVVVPMEILVSMGRFSVYCFDEGSVRFWYE